MFDIRYIELKADSNHNGPAWIARVRLSNSGQTVFFNGLALKKQRHGQFSNYVDYMSADRYWVSRPKKNGLNRHQHGRGKIFVQAEIVEEYLQYINEGSLSPSKYTVVHDVVDSSKREFFELENEAYSGTLTTQFIEGTGAYHSARFSNDHSFRTKEYVRFVIDFKSPHSQQPLGVFGAVYHLSDEGALDEEQNTIVNDSLDWFRTHLRIPHVLSSENNRHGVSWFKPKASRAIGEMLKLVAVLESKGIAVHILQTPTPGKIIYEDSWQIVAEA